MVEFLGEGILRGAIMNSGGQPAQLAGLGLEYIGPFAQEVLINACMCLEPVDVLLGEFFGGFQDVDFLFQFFKQFGRRREAG